MKNFIEQFVSTFLLVMLAIGGVAIGKNPAEATNLERKIVVFRIDTPQFVRESLVRGVGGVLGDRLDIVRAIAVRLTPEAEKLLLTQPFVERIDNDEVVTAISHRFSLAGQAQAQGQTTPWNITKIMATQAWALAKGTNVPLAVIDTGVSTSHPDLVVLGGVNTIYPWRTYNDDNGHGSHVAGVACARDNTTGVVGVAPDCSLYAIKVLNANGSGYISDIIEGIQWAVDQQMKIVNMSFGLSSDIQSLHDALTVADQAGVVEVAAAGNSGPGPNTTLYPANYPAVISVGALDSNDQVPSWSSRGKVDLAAPGVSIYSTYKGNRYATLSGTSMAAPHVAGVAVLRRQIKPNETPEQVKQVITNTTDPLPYSTSTVGPGRVNAQKVVEAL